MLLDYFQVKDSLNSEVTSHLDQPAEPQISPLSTVTPYVWFLNIAYLEIVVISLKTHL